MVNGQLQVNFLWPFSLISPKLNTSHVQEILGLVPVFFLHCRPLPLEMLTYAREDTHYLLYIYDVLRNQLIQRSNEMKNLLRSVYTKSADLCGTVSLANFFSYWKIKKKFSICWLDIYWISSTLSWWRSLSETNPLISSANQWAGFYKIGTSVMKEFKQHFNFLVHASWPSIEITKTIRSKMLFYHFTIPENVMNPSKRPSWHLILKCLVFTKRCHFLKQTWSFC